jgi:hypothetical protein
MGEWDAISAGSARTCAPAYHSGNLRVHGNDEPLLDAGTAETGDSERIIHPPESRSGPWPAASRHCQGIRFERRALPSDGELRDGAKWFSRGGCFDTFPTRISLRSARGTTRNGVFSQGSCSRDRAGQPQNSRGGLAGQPSGQLAGSFDVIPRTYVSRGAWHRGCQGGWSSRKQRRLNPEAARSRDASPGNQPLPSRSRRSSRSEATTEICLRAAPAARSPESIPPSRGSP